MWNPNKLKHKGGRKDRIMHELALIQEVVDQVINLSYANNINRVTLVKVTVGKLSGVFPHALQFGFEAIKSETILSEARLIINEVEPLLCCQDCSVHFTSTEAWFTCPRCGGHKVEIKKGRDFILEYFEGDAKGEE